MRACIGITTSRTGCGSERATRSDHCAITRSDLVQLTYKEKSELEMSPERGAVCKHAELEAATAASGTVMVKRPFRQKGDDPRVRRSGVGRCRVGWADEDRPARRAWAIVIVDGNTFPGRESIVADPETTRSSRPLSAKTLPQWTAAAADEGRG